MNILWGGDILANAATGGVARYSAELMRGLVQKPNTRILAVCPGTAPPYPAKAQGLTQISERGPGLITQTRIRAFSPNIFQGAYYESSPCPKLPVCQIAYDFLDARYPSFLANAPGFASLQRKRLEEADAILAISESTREDVLRFTSVTGDKVQVVYPIIPDFLPASPPDVAQVPDQQSYWLWVGPRGGYKNFRTFLRAFAAVAKDTDTHLVLVGGREPRLEPDEFELLLREKILDRVTLRLQVTDSELIHLYVNARAFVQSSLWEGFGIPLVEALCCGTRLVVSDIPVFREVAGPYATYAPPETVDAWVAALKSIAAEALSEPSRIEMAQWIRKRFDATEQINTVYSTYNALI